VVVVEGGRHNRASLQLLRRPRRPAVERQIAQELRRSSGLPGKFRANASGGNQFNRMLSGGMGDARLQLEIRGEDLPQANRLAREVQALMDATPGVADARVGRDVGRPELGIFVDRPRAALLGLGVTGIANTIRTNVAGTQAALYRMAGNEYPSSSACGRRIASRSPMSTRCWSTTSGPVVRSGT
jgi:HAE1 family hydrophobic/amphiphilic exporter-1